MKRSKVVLRNGIGPLVAFLFLGFFAMQEKKTPTPHAIPATPNPTSRPIIIGAWPSRRAPLFPSTQTPLSKKEAYNPIASPDTVGAPCDLPRINKTPVPAAHSPAIGRDDREDSKYLAFSLLAVVALFKSLQSLAYRKRVGQRYLDYHNRRARSLLEASHDSIAEERELSPKTLEPGAVPIVVEEQSMPIQENCSAIAWTLLLPDTPGNIKVCYFSDQRLDLLASATSNSTEHYFLRAESITEATVNGQEGFAESSEKCLEEDIDYLRYWLDLEGERTPGMARKDDLSLYKLVHGYTLSPQELDYCIVRKAFYSDRLLLKFPNSGFLFKRKGVIKNAHIKKLCTIIDSKMVMLGSRIEALEQSDTERGDLRFTLLRKNILRVYYNTLCQERKEAHKSFPILEQWTSLDDDEVATCTPAIFSQKHPFFFSTLSLLSDATIIDEKLFPLFLASDGEQRIAHMHILGNTESIKRMKEAFSIAQAMPNDDACLLSFGKAELDAVSMEDLFLQLD